MSVNTSLDLFELLSKLTRWPVNLSSTRKHSENVLQGIQTFRFSSMSVCGCWSPFLFPQQSLTSCCPDVSLATLQTLYCHDPVDTPSVLSFPALLLKRDSTCGFLSALRSSCLAFIHQIIANGSTEGDINYSDLLFFYTPLLWNHSVET